MILGKGGAPQLRGAFFFLFSYIHALHSENVIVKYFGTLIGIILRRFLV